MSEIVRVKNVTKKYKNNRGIENVSLAMEQGEIHVLLGANGAGKSTLMRVIAGLLIPDSGEVLYCDTDTNYSADTGCLANNCTGDLKARLFAGGFLIEQPELFGYMTAYDNLLQKAIYYPDGRNSAEEALRAVGLAGRRYGHRGPLRARSIAAKAQEGRGLDPSQYASRSRGCRYCRPDNCHS
jgi:ABC-2 type transport system ATP-binding protein